MKPPKGSLPPELARWGAWVQSELLKTSGDRERAKVNSVYLEKQAATTVTVVQDLRDNVGDVVETVEAIRNDEIPFVENLVIDAATTFANAQTALLEALGLPDAQLYTSDTEPMGPHMPNGSVWISPTSGGLSVWREWSDEDGTYSGWQSVDPAPIQTPINRLNQSYLAMIRSQDIDDKISEAIDSAVAAAVLRIDSSKGSVFKNNAISTVLNVTVYYAGNVVTNILDLHNVIGPTAFLEWFWRRDEDNDFGVISSADPRLSNGGFSLTVSPDDVNEKTVFQCILND